MNMRHLLSMAMVVFVGAGAVPATSVAQTGWYFGLGAGESETELGLSDIDDFSIVSGSVDDTATGTKFFAAYQFNENSALEISFVDLGEASIDATSNGLGFLYSAGPVGAKVETDGINVALVGILPVSEKIDVLGKLGFLMWDAEASLTNAAFGTVSADDDGTDLMFGGGGQFKVGKNVKVRIEFERFTDVSDADTDLLSVSIVFTAEGR